MKVVATADGIWEGRYRTPGDTFFVPDDHKASWFEPYGDEEPAPRRAPPSGQKGNGVKGKAPIKEAPVDDDDTLA